MSDETTDSTDDTGGNLEIKSVRALARAVGRSHSAIVGWRKRDDWPAEVPLEGPWTPADVKGLKDWAAEVLQEDRAGEMRERNDDGFFRWFGDYRAAQIPRGPFGLPTDDLEQLPPMIYRAFDRSVINGTRTLTPAEVVNLVKTFVRYRVLMVDLCESLGRWLAHKPPAEIARRMRGGIYCPTKWAAERLECIGEPDRGEVLRAASAEGENDEGEGGAAND